MHESGIMNNLTFHISVHVPYHHKTQSVYSSCFPYLNIYIYQYFYTAFLENIITDNIE